ncbi:lipopolysaccharide transport periplasmic protein LptA [Helicobacter sp. 23-1045]
MRAMMIYVMAIFALFADDVLEITALHFRSDEASGIIELNENVEIKKGKDELFAPKVVVKVDKNRKPQHYWAFGGVKFKVRTKDKRVLSGSAREAHYNALNGQYHLKGNAKVKESDKINEVVGEEIIINNEAGYLNITGTKNRPAKVIFQMDEQDDKSN